jgi:hypothetical protein
MSALEQMRLKVVEVGHSVLVGGRKSAGGDMRLDEAVLGQQLDVDSRALRYGPALRSERAPWAHLTTSEAAWAGNTAFPWVIRIWPSVRILEARRTLWSLFGCSPVSAESVRTECRVRIVTGRPNTTSPGPSGRCVPM